MLSVAIVGARGYLGRECVRLLLQHPQVGEILPVSFSEPKGTLGDTVPTFRHHKGLHLRAYDDPDVQAADVFFFATANGEAKARAPDLPEEALVIDLSRDHRVEALQASAAVLSDGATVAAGTAGSGTWAFGLTESPLRIEQGVTRVANPGCYPTAALLGMAPVLAHGLVGDGPIVVDGKSGVSGAGATPRPDLHFTETNDDLRAYKVVGHDHGEEMRLGAARLAKEGGPYVRFTPHLVPINRGLLATSYIPLRAGTTQDDVDAAFHDAYDDTATVRIMDEARIGNVRNSALADVAYTIDTECDMLIVRSAIDNLLKGGSAQAVQNMNRALGLDETSGLPLYGGGP